MRPSRFVSALVVAGALGYLAGRYNAPTAISASNEPNAQTVQTQVLKEANVTKVVDGDTVELPLSGNMEKVRLLAIDTPERGQRWFSESREALAEIVKGRPVEIRFETDGLGRRDKYGRLLVYLFVEGRNANVEMVRRGWSPYVSKYGGERYAHELAKAEEEARLAHRGIWSSRP